MQTDRLIKELKREEFFNKTLENHKMFKWMNGNPRSIITYAKFYNYKFVKDNHLLAIYLRMIDNNNNATEATGGI